MPIWPKIQSNVCDTIYWIQSSLKTDHAALLMMFISHSFPFIQLKNDFKLANDTQIYTFHEMHTYKRTMNIQAIQFGIAETYGFYWVIHYFSCESALFGAMKCAWLQSAANHTHSIHLDVSKSTNTFKWKNNANILLFILFFTARTFQDENETNDSLFQNVILKKWIE